MHITWYVINMRHVVSVSMANMPIKGSILLLMPMKFQKFKYICQLVPSYTMCITVHNYVSIEPRYNTKSDNVMYTACTSILYQNIKLYMRSVSQSNVGRCLVTCSILGHLSSYLANICFCGKFL